MSKRDLLSTLHRARKLGYAARVSTYRGETAMANKLNAISRPVFRGSTAVGALVVLWPREFLDPERFAEIHLQSLKEATALITADLTRIKY